jgi:tRNA(Ile)-lysidine synthase
VLSDIRQCLQTIDPQFSSKRYLVGVSGGIDSVALLHALHLLGLDCGAAHCHFGLRGAEADADLRHVEQLAGQYGFPFYPVYFDTIQEAQKRGVSVQMAARDLRFSFFERIAGEYGFDYIALGTQLNDRAETFLLNLARGTGLAGLRGIPVLRDNILRPMFETNREEILAFAKAHRLSWREDSSNAERKYKRNRLRHDVLPVLQELNPSFLEGFKQTLRHLQTAYQVVQRQTHNIKKHAISGTGKRINIPFHLVKDDPAGQLFLHEYLQSIGFTPSQTEDVLQLKKADTGKFFDSPDRRLVLNRGRLEIAPLPKDTPSVPLEIFLDTTYIDSPIGLSLQRLELTGNQWQSATRHEVWIDFDRLKFPLLLRPWQAGDSMRPLGMKHRKKVSDILIDEKVSTLHKSEQMVLCSGGEIVWLVGYKVSEDFKITRDTRYAYYCKAEL